MKLAALLFLALLSGCTIRGTISSPYGSVSFTGDGKTIVEVDGKAIVRRVER